jgi:hypothetical protein
LEELVCHKLAVASAGCGIPSDLEGLATEIVDQPDDQAGHNADNDAGHQRKVESAVLTAMDDITRQASDAEGKFWAKVEESAEEEKDGSGEKEEAAELLYGVHKESLA